MSRILVTGASGIVGSELVEQLQRARFSVVAMTHQRPDIRLGDDTLVAADTELTEVPAPGAVTRITGDVRRSRFGLDDGTYARLARTTDLIVHCAALTDFRLEPALYPPVNTAGTAEAIALAFAGRRAPTPILYVSTAYVCGWRQGTILETELDGSAGFVNAYEESKYEAERLVRAAGTRGLPFVIVRPSIIVGATRTGRLREFHNIYAVLKLVTEGRIRALPGDYDATLDLVPIDYVVASLARLATTFEAHVGGCFHLTNGRATSLREFSDVLAEYPTMLVPRIVPPSSFDIEAMPPIERRLYLRGVKAYDGYFLNRVVFPNDNMLRLLQSARPPVHGKTQLRQLIGFCEKRGFLGKPIGLRRPAAAVLDARGGQPI